MIFFKKRRRSREEEEDGGGRGGRKSKRRRLDAASAGCCADHTEGGGELVVGSPQRSTGETGRRAAEDGEDDASHAAREGMNAEPGSDAAEIRRSSPAALMPFGILSGTSGLQTFQGFADCLVCI